MDSHPKLRIAVLSRNFVATGGGAERYSIALVEQLAQQHEIHVFAQTIAHQHPSVTYHHVGTPLRRPRWINQLYFATATWWATRKGFDIVHSHENTWHGNVQTVHVLPVKHNLFYERHGLPRALRWLKVATSPRLLAYLALEKARYALRSPRRIVSVSRTLNDVMLQTYPRAASAMQFITPGIDAVPGLATPAAKAAARVALNLPLEGRCILFVGNDFKKKGLPTLIPALAQLPSNIYVAVAGQSAQLPEMQRAAASAGLAGRIFFLGAVATMNQAYSAADSLVHPTLEDTYAMVVLEAMAHGLPVVVSAAKYCGIAADLQDGVNALLVQNPRNVQELTQQCRAMLDNSSLAKSLSSAALAFAKQHSWSNVAVAHEDIYKNIINK